MARVLIVDDFEDNRAMYACYLELCGHTILEAGDGEEALRVAREAGPDIIVMDLSLPRMDGWEATRQVKSDPRISHVPVIALTGHVYAQHENEAVRVGADAFLAKPCAPEALASKIQELLAAAA